MIVIGVASLIIGVAIYISTASSPMESDYDTGIPGAKPTHPAARAKPKKAEKKPPPIYYLDGGKLVAHSLPTISGEMAWNQSVDARALWREYDDNEVAADNRWKGRRFLLRGVVAEVTKDFVDDVVVAIESPNEYFPTHAYLRDVSVARAAELSKRDEIAMVCTGSGRVMNSPVLLDCVILTTR